MERGTSILSHLETDSRRHNDFNGQLLARQAASEWIELDRELDVPRQGSACSEPEEGERRGDDLRRGAEFDWCTGER